MLISSVCHFSFSFSISIVASDFSSYTRGYRNLEVLKIHSPSYELVLFNELLKMIHETVSNSFGSLRFESDSLNRLELLLSLQLTQ